jgi:ABC-type multidrug transport system permease subunit
MRLAISLASVFTMLAITYAGFTFPTFSMPGVAQVLNKIFPISYWTIIFTGQSLRAEDISNGISQMLYMAGFIVLGCCFIPRLKYILSNKKYWWKI